MVRCFAYIILFLLIFVKISFGIDGNTHISSELYLYEQDNINHTRLYQSIRFNLNLWNQFDKRITLQNYSRWTTDFDNKYSSDPELFVYNAILGFKNVIPKSNLQLGRQFVYTPIGSDLLDGINITTYYIPKLKFQIFGGFKVNRLNPEVILNDDEYKVGGLQSYYTVSRNYMFGVNWFVRFQNEQIIYNSIGIINNVKYKNSNLYSRITIDPDLVSLTEILTRIDIYYQRWQFGLEYLYREPLVNTNSIFYIINSKQYNKIRFNPRYKVNKNFAISGHINYSFYEYENSLSGSIGIQTSLFSIFYNYQNGYGGDRNGVSGSVYYNLNTNLSLYGSANISRYRIQEDQKDLSDAYSTSLGIIGRIKKSWQVRTEWQFMRNAIESHSSRIYLKLDKHFKIR